MRKLFSVLLVAVMLTMSCGAETCGVSAQAAVLYDPLCETVLFQRNECAKLGMASTTKIMTALVALDWYDPETSVEIQPEWCGIEGSSIYLQPGETMTISDLLYGLLLESGNDAAVALASIRTGDPEDFVAAMNQKAADLGLEHTHFCNPNGLSDENHYTCALDLARLAAYGMKSPVFSAIVGTKSSTVANRSMQNHNKLLWQIGACGVKTGYTKKDGRCLVSALVREGRMLIAVTLNAPDDWTDHRIMYEQGFSAMTPYTPVEAGVVSEIPVIGGDHVSCPLYCTESFTAAFSGAERDQITVQILGPRFAYASEVKGGIQYGDLRVSCGESVLFETPLYYQFTAHEQTGQKTLWQRIQSWVLRWLGR